MFVGIDDVAVFRLCVPTNTSPLHAGFLFPNFPKARPTRAFPVHPAPKK